MSLLDRITRSTPRQEPAAAPAPAATEAPDEEAQGAPAAPAAAETAAASAPSRTDDMVGDLLVRGAPSFEGAPVSAVVERSERELRMRAIEDTVQGIVQREGIHLTPTERSKVYSRLYDEIFGLGPLEPLLEDSTVRRIVVNGPREVMAERYGGLEAAELAFKDDEHLVRIIRRIATLIDVPLDRIPRMQSTLPDGAKVQAVLPPLATNPTLTITKLLGNPFLNLQSQKETAGTSALESFYELKYRLLERLIAQLDQEFLTRGDQTVLRRQVQEIILRLLDEQGVALNRTQRNQLVFELLDEVTGLGPLEALLRDPTITEIMVNGPKQVWYERDGKLQLSDRQFRDDDHLISIIQKICSGVGRRIDESSPLVDARLKDGSRVNAVIPPIALRGPSLTIRKFSKDPLMMDDLIAYGTLSPQIAQFLKAAVQARMNIVVSGGTGSGKTTLLNCLSGFIPLDERIVTVEDAAELQLKQPHVVTLESRPANIEGKGAVTIRDLVVNALRMRPDRIVVGECRRGEALDMLQAMNTGHDGSLTTAHANSPRELISRLETMVLMAGMDLPVRAIREQISNAVDIVVQQARMRDGSRKITQVTEVVGMEVDVVTLQDIFVLRQFGVDAEGKVLCQHEATGLRPQCTQRFEEAGISLPAELFAPGEGRGRYA